MTPPSARLGLVAGRDTHCAALVQRLLGIAVRYLPQAYTDGEFAFTLNGTRGPDGSWQLHRSGTSQRYGAIAALGLLRLPVPDQRALLAGETGRDLVGRLAKSLWVVTALVAARRHVDVEQDLAAARGRLLAARGAAVYPHTTGEDAPWYRAHVGSFADQVYPVQALARLHGSADDPEALATANAVAGVICDAQGPGGQWWWHYDSRTGGVVEGYPVYSVHQHAMAPMALLDLADAGGDGHLDAICRGLRWLESPPEAGEDLVLDEPPVTWRKVARGDRGKLVRGLRAASTRLRPGMRIAALDRVYRPRTVDRECRPYELGWLLMTWLSSPLSSPAERGGHG